MDIDLLAKMVGDLILEHDEVALPGVGTFVAELVGASFSDKGFTINPPYRKLSFRQREGDGDLLVDFYAKTNSLEKSTARDILTRFLSEMKEVLKTKKFIVFPGLGRLRATKENLFFFVPDEDLNIYPEGFGLEPVSLKSHEEVEEISELTETVEALADINGTEASESVPSTPEIPSESTETPESVLSTPETPAPEIPSAGVAAPADKTAVAASPAEPEPLAPAPRKAHESSSHTRRHRSRRHRMPVWQKELIILASSFAAFLLLLAVLGRVAPRFVDRFLYNREELEILYK